jgi:4-oxalocrotonate tautomerase
MPDIHVNMLRGVRPGDIAALGAALTEATASTLGLPAERIRVTISECAAEHWFVGGTSLAAAGFGNQS